jgi:hypothetical protein
MNVLGVQAFAQVRALCPDVSRLTAMRPPVHLLAGSPVAWR